MRRALLVVLVLAAPSSAAASAACEADWQDSYAADWDFPRDKWLSLCRANLDPRDALREEQSAFMARCKERFAKPDARAVAGQAEIYCALGKPGRSRLYALAGLPDESAPKPAPPKPAKDWHIPPPGAGGMGPLMQALRDARSRWKPDACFSGLEYMYKTTPYTTDEEWKRAARMHDDPSYSMTFLEEHDYAFHSAEIESGGYRVAYGDHIDNADCTGLDRRRGPDVNGFPHVPFFSRCLKNVTLDLPQALSVLYPKAAPAGDLFAVLGTLTADFLEDPGCEVMLSDRGPFPPCSQTPGWDARSLRRAVGREVWAIAVGYRTDFVDAATGKRLGSARGALSLRDFSRSALYCDPCPIPTITGRR